jgi:zinc transport system permease protein
MNELAMAWALFREAIATSAVAGMVLGPLGIFLVLRGRVFTTAALTQASAAGMVLAWVAAGLTGTAAVPIVGGITAVLAGAAWLSGDEVSQRSERRTGLLFLAAGATVVLLGGRIPAEAHDLDALLYGTGVLVRMADMLAVAAVAGAILVCLVGFGPTLAFAVLDPIVARVHGLPVRMISTTLFAATAVMLAVAARALGALPVFALSIVPALAALRIAPTLRSAFVLAGLFGFVAGGGGFLAAWVADLPVGGTQTAVALAIWALAGAGRRSA